MIRLRFERKRMVSRERKHTRKKETQHAFLYLIK